jgi:2-iminoacetate synthase
MTLELLDTQVSSMNFPETLPDLYSVLENSKATTPDHLTAIIEKAQRSEGLDLNDAAALLTAPADFNERIFDAARSVNLQVKGKQITFYGVVYIHDFCIDHCTYCGDSRHADFNKRKLLSADDFVEDVSSLLARHDLQQICFLSGEAPRKFNTDQLITYLRLLSRFYHHKIILNIPPVSVEEFGLIRSALPANRLHFRVFQETFDRDIYRKAHVFGPKADFSSRLDAQARARQAGFDEIGFGVLYGLNDKRLGTLFDTLAMLAHAQSLQGQYGKCPQSISFPRVQPAPGINYVPPGAVDDDALIRCVTVVKLAAPEVDTIITCRESAAFRRRIRPIVNIEDFAARPGPGGNMNPNAHLQMLLPDMRTGEEIREEISNAGYTVR